MILRFCLVMVFMYIAMFLGWVLGYLYHKDEYKEAVEIATEQAETRALSLIREEYARRETDIRLLLDELGEALDVDVVELPSFGYVILRGSVELSESLSEPHMEDFV